MRHMDGIQALILIPITITVWVITDTAIITPIIIITMPIIIMRYRIPEPIFTGIRDRDPLGFSLQAAGTVRMVIAVLKEVPLTRVPPAIQDAQLREHTVPREENPEVPVAAVLVLVQSVRNVHRAPVDSPPHQVAAAAVAAVADRTEVGIIKSCLTTRALLVRGLKLHGQTVEITTDRPVGMGINKARLR